jgi:hypothetical protein
MLVASGVLALVPYVAYHGLFGRLFWFGDDISQMDQIDISGFWHWTCSFYGENFIPVFKALWGGVALVTGGSYATFIAVIWLNHGLNVALFGRLMRTCGLSWAAVLFAQVIFGLTPITVETLGFSVEWSVLLSVTFMLLALDNVFRPRFKGASLAWILLSVLTFVKGVLTGPLLALAVLLPEGNGPRPPFSRRAMQAAFYLLPSVAIGLLIALQAEGNHRHMAGHGAEAAVYGTWYWCLNPTTRLFAVESWGWRTVVALGLAKLILIAWTLRHSRGSQRSLFIVLVAFDVANAVLLGVGRFNFGITTAVSSRYQYASLMGILPLAGFWFAWALEKLPAPAKVRGFVSAAVLATLALVLCTQWSPTIESWSGWRGTEPRRILVTDSSPPPAAVPGYPGFPTARAKELIAKYNLH